MRWDKDHDIDYYIYFKKIYSNIDYYIYFKKIYSNMVKNKGIYF